MADSKPTRAKVQHCDYCGQEVGVFDHSRILDGPVVCGDSACNREAQADDRAQNDERRQRAEEDDYGRY